MKAHNTLCYVIISAATVLTLFWPLAICRVESFLFAVPPFQGVELAVYVETNCPLSLAFDKILHIHALQLETKRGMVT